jgi:hypothetical protein
MRIRIRLWAVANVVSTVMAGPVPAICRVTGAGRRWPGQARP